MSKSRKNSLSGEPMCWSGLKLYLSWTQAYKVPTTQSCSIFCAGS